MKSTWNNKYILITGAGSGMGKALSELLAEHGARLILTDINKKNLKETSDKLAKSVKFSMVADVSNKSDWQELGKKIKSEIGYLDVLVNNAGMSSFGNFDELSEQLFDKVMNVNFNGVVLGCREMVPLLHASERGLIANVSSVFSLITMPMMSPYHASKFVVRGFTEALRQDMMFSKKILMLFPSCQGVLKPI
ncbi:MAG: SDR family oxidoreductase [Bermanella sp.]